MNQETTKLKKYKLFYVQPILAGYRVPIIEKLSDSFNVFAFYDNTDAQKNGHADYKSNSFQAIQSTSISFFRKKIFFQKKVITKTLQIKPDAIITFANTRYLSFWLLIIISYLSKIKFYAHGQGLYSYSNPSLFRKFMYRAICRLSTKYICYTELSKQSLIASGCDPKKLITIQNSLELQTTIHPSQKTYDEQGILFIGRLREGCRLDILIEAVKSARKNKFSIELQVIGSGYLEEHYKALYKDETWIHWHGAVHNNHCIAEISKLCRIGCYPGDAGLSVVHMFSLALPPLVHRKIEDHMGPEPSYIIENKNGFLFNSEPAENDLSTTIETIWELTNKDISLIANSAHNKYLEMNNPSMGDQFLHLILDNQNSPRA